MKRKQDGFGAPEIIIVVVIVGLAGVLGWSLASRQMYPKSNSASQNSIPESKERIRVRLIDRTTQQPIVHTDADVRSNNGLECITIPCPSNDLQISVTTDENGEFIVSRSYFQDKTYVETDRYLPARVLLGDDQSSIVVQLSPGQ